MSPRPTLILLPICACALAAPASASSFAGTTAGAASGGSSASSGSSSGDDKVLVLARTEAASFVATDGQLRGVQLEAALHHLRAQSARARAATDLELARQILAL